MSPNRTRIESIEFRPTVQTPSGNQEMAGSHGFGEVEKIATSYKNNIELQGGNETLLPLIKAWLIFEKSVKNKHLPSLKTAEISAFQTAPIKKVGHQQVKMTGSNYYYAAAIGKPVQLLPCTILPKCS